MKWLLLLFLSAPAFALEYGIDRLSSTSDNEATQILHGKKLAALTHAAGKDKNGNHLIDLLHKNFSLVKIFAPEHGLRSLQDDWVDDGTDETTGLPVISLYKNGATSANPQDLMGLDAIVVDLQDVGVRYYTYFSTIAKLMPLCASMNIEMIILDRPNLLGGKIIEGKTLDENLTGNFIGYYNIPTRHGMTLGELAHLYNQEKQIKTNLTVIKALGWKRENLLKSERTWIPSSPALTTLQQVGLYALWGSLENFNLAVGRGKTNELAFRVLGAPWITLEESHKLAVELNNLKINHIKFSPFTWTVTRDLYNGNVAKGVMIDWDGEEVRTDELTYKVTSVLKKLFKDRLSTPKPIAFGSQSMIDSMLSGIFWNTYQEVIDREIEQFKIRREKYLLY